MIHLLAGYDVGTLIGALLGCIIVIAIYVLLIRWVFRIDEQVNNQRASLWILMKMAEKQGVSPEEFEVWKKSFKIK